MLTVFMRVCLCIVKGTSIVFPGGEIDYLDRQGPVDQQTQPQHAKQTQIKTHLDVI